MRAEGCCRKLCQEQMDAQMDTTRTLLFFQTVNLCIQLRLFTVTQRNRGSHEFVKSGVISARRITTTLCVGQLNRDWLWQYTHLCGLTFDGELN